MTWFKVDDSFYDHPKVFDAPDCAVALWTRAAAWSARNLTDGFVPAGMPARLCDDPDTAVKELVRRGLWLRAKDGYRFHDWADYQPTREDVLAERKRWAEKKANQRAARRAEMDKPSSTGKVSPHVSPGDSPEDSPQGHPRGLSGESQRPVPSRPDPDSPYGESPPSATPQGPRKRGTRIPLDFAPTPAMVGWARDHVPHVDGRHETAKFINYWTAKSGKDATKVDWPATWRNWMLTAAERTPVGASARQPAPYRNPADISAYEGEL
jgi:hypothetical protein